jgi:hypothetical protein
MVLCISKRDMGLIVNYLGLLITSLKPDDIVACYRTPKPTVAMNDSFLEHFRVKHEYFESLVEDWFYDEEWPVKKSESISQCNISKSTTSF